jgi:GNAT superfamily N-acetyltransferase
MNSIRAATPADIPAILDLIRALATYERAPNAVKTTEADLLRDGFGEQPCFECLIAENDEGHGQPAGFALYFYNYSTWRGRPGIHLEDLFVLPRFRGQGIGKALLARVAARAAERGCPRLQWDVLAWNQTAIDFYQSLGAQFLDEWRIMRVADEGIGALAALAAASEQSR